jgi:hypothetical protein
VPPAAATSQLERCQCDGSFVDVAYGLQAWCTREHQPSIMLCCFWMRQVSGLGRKAQVHPPHAYCGCILSCSHHMPAQVYQAPKRPSAPSGCFFQNLNTAGAPRDKMATTGRYRGPSW